LDSTLLNKIFTTPLSRINVDGGDVLHGMKDSDNGYSGFGESYFSFIEGGVIKGWKRHNEMILNLVVPIGNAKFVFCNEESNEFRAFEIGENNYARLTVPAGIWFGFKGLKDPESLILNISNIPHDPTEVDKLALSAFKYDWK